MFLFGFTRRKTRKGQISLISVHCSEIMNFETEK